MAASVEAEAANGQIEPFKRAHIADISQFPSPGTYLDGYVVLVWPYSSTTKELSLLVAEKDVSLRQAEGQIKVTFHEEVAREVAKLRPGIGDDVRLFLAGIDVVHEEDELSTPGKKTGFGIHVSHKVHVELNHGKENAKILKHIAKSDASNGLRSPDSSILLDQTPGKDFRLSGFGPSSVKSTPRLKTTWLASSLADTNDLSDRPRKRTKFSRNSGAWRLVDGSESDLEILGSPSQNTSLGSSLQQPLDDEIQISDVEPFVPSPVGNYPGSEEDAKPNPSPRSPVTSAKSAESLRNHDQPNVEVLLESREALNLIEEPAGVSAESLIIDPALEAQLSSPHVEQIFEHSSHGAPETDVMQGFLAAATSEALVNNDSALPGAAKVTEDHVQASTSEVPTVTLRGEHGSDFAPVDLDALSQHIDLQATASFESGLTSIPQATDFSLDEFAMSGQRTQPQPPFAFSDQNLAGGLAPSDTEPANVGSPPLRAVEIDTQHGVPRTSALTGAHGISHDVADESAETTIEASDEESEIEVEPLSVQIDISDEDSTESSETEAIELEPQASRATDVLSIDRTVYAIASDHLEQEDDGSERGGDPARSISSVEKVTVSNLDDDADDESEQASEEEAVGEQSASDTSSTDVLDARPIDGNGHEQQLYSGGSLPPSAADKSTKPRDIETWISLDKRQARAAFVPVEQESVELDLLPPNITQGVMKEMITNEEGEVVSTEHDAAAEADAWMDLSRSLYTSAQENIVSDAQSQMMHPARSLDPGHKEPTASQPEPQTPNKQDMQDTDAANQMDGPNTEFFSRRKLLGKLSSTGGLHSEYFTPRKSVTESETHRPQLEFSPDSGKVTSSTAESRIAEVDIESEDTLERETRVAQVDAPEEEVEQGGQRADQALQPMGIAGASLADETRQTYCVPLSTAIDYFDQPIDIIAIATTNAGTPERAKSGPRDFFVTLHLADSSGKLTAQAFRPYKDALPTPKRGEVMLLRHFTVITRQRKAFLISNDESAWAVLQPKDKKHSTDSALSSGPPVEYAMHDFKRASGLLQWWQEVGQDTFPPRHDTPKPSQDTQDSSAAPPRRSPRQNRKRASQIQSAQTTQVEASSSPVFVPSSPDSHPLLSGVTAVASQEVGYGKEQDIPLMSGALHPQSQPDPLQTPVRDIHRHEGVMSHGNKDVTDSASIMTGSDSSRRHRHERRDTSVVHELRDGTQWIDVEDAEVVSVSTEGDPEDDQAEAAKKSTNEDTGAVDTSNIIPTSPGIRRHTRSQSRVEPPQLEDSTKQSQDHPLSSSPPQRSRKTSEKPHGEPTSPKTRTQTTESSPRVTRSKAAQQNVHELRDGARYQD